MPHMKDDTEFDGRCVFVLSTGRVGTQTLAALLNLSEEIESVHEPWPFHYGLSKFAYLYRDSPEAKAVLREAFLGNRLRYLEDAWKKERIYVETSPQNTFLEPVIIDLFPQARFLHVVRDPRAVVRSAMRRGWYAGHHYDQWRLEPTTGFIDGRSWQDFTAFEKNIWLCCETNRWIEHFLNSIFSDRWLRISSEQIFSGELPFLDELYGFSGAERPSREAIGSILIKRLNAQKSGEFPASSDWTDLMNDRLGDLSATILSESPRGL